MVYKIDNRKKPRENRKLSYAKRPSYLNKFAISLFSLCGINCMFPSISLGNHVIICFENQWNQCHFQLRLPSFWLIPNFWPQPLCRLSLSSSLFLSHSLCPLFVLSWFLVHSGLSFFLLANIAHFAHAEFGRLNTRDKKTSEKCNCPTCLLVVFVCIKCLPFICMGFG